jgi:DNA-binding transcriptional regulator YiaG
VLGLTQAGMADLLGVPVATVRKWEQRRVEPEDAA